MGRDKAVYAVVAQKRVKAVLPDGRKTYYKTRYRIRYWTGNVVRYINTGLTEKNEAYRMAEKLLKDGVFSGAPMFEEYAYGFFDDGSKYITTRELTGKPLGIQYKVAQRVNLTMFLREFKGLNMKQMTQDFMDNWFLDQKRKGKKTNTLANYKKTFSPIFDQAVKDGIMPTNPMTNLVKLGTAGTDKKALPNNFVYKVFCEPPEYDPDEHFSPNSREDDYFLMSLISLCTGARIGEVCALQVKHFTKESSFKSPSGQILWMEIKQSYQASTKTIGPPKSESYRTVPIAGRVVSLILNRLDELVRTWGFKYREAYLFTRSLVPSGMPNQDRANQWLEDQYKKIFKVSVMPVDYSFHSLRRWFNTRALVLTGHNDYLVKRLMGHRDRANMSARYDTVSKDTYKLWIEELQPRLFGDPGDELNLPEFLRPVKTGELEMGFIRNYDSTIVVEDDD